VYENETIVAIAFHEIVEYDYMNIHRFYRISLEFVNPILARVHPKTGKLGRDDRYQADWLFKDEY